MSKIPLSWSRISGYRQCPRQFYAKNISKEYPDESDNPAFKKGNEVHKQLEDYINWRKGNGKEPSLGEIAGNVKPIIDRYFNTVDKSCINAEKQIAIGHDYKQCDWFDNLDTVKWRAILDMLIFPKPNECHINDFKTGKVRAYSEDLGQLHLSSMLIFELFPEVDTIKNAYLFAEHKQTDSHIFLRKDHPRIKASFDKEWLIINEDKNFDPIKNSYCYFCGIKDDCIYG